MGDIYAIITAVCWSSAVILFDISSKSFEALQINALKNFIGVIGFILTIIILSIPFPIFTYYELIILLSSGIIGIVIADLLFLESLRRLGSGISAVIATIYTPSIFILAYIMFNEMLNENSYYGGVLVVFGIVIVAYKIPKNLSSRDLYIGITFGILAQIFTAYSVLMIRPIMINHSIIIIALYRFSIGLFITVIILLIKNGFSYVINNFKHGLNNPNIIFGSILGTYLSVIFWLLGYKYTLAGRAAIYNQLSTVFIVVLARIFLMEQLNIKKIVGVLLSIIGAVMVAMAK